MIPSLPCIMELALSRILGLSPARGTYLFAVDATVNGSDGDELVTSDGDTVGQSIVAVPEALRNTTNLVRRDLK